MNTLLLRAYDAFAATISLADSSLVPDGVAMASMVSAADRMMKGVLRSELSEHGNRGQAVAAVHLCVARATARCEGEAPDHWIQIHLSDLRDAIEPRYDVEGRHGASRTGPGPRYGEADVGRAVLHSRFGVGTIVSVERHKADVLFAGE